METDACKNTMDTVNAEKARKKAKKRESPDQTESVKQHVKKKKKEKKNKETEDKCHQTFTGKHKKRKLNERGEEETSLMCNGQTGLHTVEDMNAPTAELKERQGTTEEKHAKRKRKKAKVAHTNCDDMVEEQSAGTSEQGHVPCMDKETDLQEATDLMNPAIQIGTRKHKKKKKNEEPTKETDRNILEELKEFIPDIESKTQFELNKIILYDLPRYRVFKKEGIALRHGRFSSAENNRLRQNVQDFLALTGVQNASRLFHTKRFPEEKQAISTLKRNHRFFERIAEGIPRTCREVFIRGRKVFDEGNYMGRFTEEEVKALLKFHTIHGSNWQKISELTGRSPFAVEKRFSQTSSNEKTGPWSQKEVQRLLRAVRNYIVTKLKSEATDKRTPTRVSREMLYRKLPYFDIALKVKTRCWAKCRMKWLSIAAARMSSGAVFDRRKSMEGKIRLIKVLYEMQIEDVTDVNWDDLSALFGDVPPATVQLKWHQLKIGYVPNWQNKCFGDIVDYLYEKILPGLVKDCEDFEDELKVDQQESFLLSDIFQDIDEEYCDDSDEDSKQTQKES
ncbi:transcription termination factor 1 isoform X2 [Myxocyprinus asiaticus]|uniref:transcription termination factor 1 isoform X2 n=1 Tax=Myxocyprinus asiaticus TaxID=70543 RepID=UPI002222D2B2|nr:transcription termination factor 1 isoform X2 [Myxocyprinus asiaticus]